MIDEAYIQSVKIDKEVTDNIKFFLKSNNMNMKQLSEMDESLSYGYLRQFLQGNKPVVSLEFVKKICDCLNVDLAMIFGGNIKYLK